MRAAHDVIRLAWYLVRRSGRIVARVATVVEYVAHMLFVIFDWLSV